MQTRNRKPIISHTKHCNIKNCMILMEQESLYLVFTRKTKIRPYWRNACARLSFSSIDQCDLPIDWRAIPLAIFYMQNNVWGPDLIRGRGRSSSYIRLVSNHSTKKKKKHQALRQVAANFATMIKAVVHNLEI